MSDIAVILHLPEALVERARAQGLLDDKRMVRLLTAEVERIEAWHRLDQSLEPVREAFRADHAGMTEDEVIAMMDEIVDEVRAEQKKRDPEES